MPVHETDTLIIGGGITSAMLAQKLAELRPGRKITIVEAGRSIFDTQNRGRYRERAMEYGEHPWHDDYIEDQQAAGIISMTMAVGGLALHWGGACNRFSEEDLRLKSMYGLATDWPIEWAELERYYCEAERRLNVSGEPSPHAEDRRSQPYPQGPIPLSYNLQILKTWAERSGIKFSPLPMARNLTPSGGRGACCVYDTCGEVCPSGARYSPDYTFRQLMEPKKIVLHDRTLVRKLILDERRSTIVAAQGVHQDRPADPIEYRAKTFVIASGYCWSSHLLLLSANARFPDGLANRSGLVGRFMNGHSFLNATANIDDQTFPGQNITHSLISREYFRCPTSRPFVRHDTRVWESSAGRDPRLRPLQRLRPHGRFAQLLPARPRRVPGVGTVPDEAGLPSVVSATARADHPVADTARSFRLRGSRCPRRSSRSAPNDRRPVLHAPARPPGGTAQPQSPVGPASRPRSP